MFLANNVKFASLNDILTFIDNVRMEASQWKYDDYDVLDKDKCILLLSMKLYRLFL